MRRLIVLPLIAAGLACAQQAFVLGNAVTAQRPGRPVPAEPWKVVAAEIQIALIENYSRTRGLEPTADEIAAVRAGMKAVTEVVADAAERLRRDLIRNGLDAESAAQQAEAFRAEESARTDRFVLTLIRYWKVGRELYRQHGGRVRLSAFGFQEPIDAMEQFLIEEERRGHFSIPDLRFRAQIWAVFQDKTGGDGMVGGAKAAAIFAKPPWERP